MLSVLFDFDDCCCDCNDDDDVAITVYDNDLIWRSDNIAESLKMVQLPSGHCDGCMLL